MLKEKNFNEIFDDILELVNTSGLSRNLVVAVCSDLNRSKSFICRGYTGIKNYVKNVYMESADRPLDRHKVIACIMVSLLNELRLDESCKLSKSELFIQKIVIYTGLSLLRTWIISDNENYKNAGLIASLNKNRGFSLPEQICDNKPYARNWAQELYYGHKENKLFILSLSNELFLIEKYNRQLSEGE